MCTGLPSKSTSPSSNGWMPAIDLISVDLPAPLSPTRAITSPSRTAKSTSFSACTRGRLLPHRLVDGAALPAREDVLDAGRRGILAGDRNRLEPVVLEGRDRRTAEPVVRGEHAVDLVAVLGEHLLEDGQALLRVPVGPLIARLRQLEDPAL